jgi:hypothetical protein
MAISSPARLNNSLVSTIIKTKERHPEGWRFIFAKGALNNDFAEHLKIGIFLSQRMIEKNLIF